MWGAAVQNSSISTVLANYTVCVGVCACVCVCVSCCSKSYSYVQHGVWCHWGVDLILWLCCFIDWEYRRLLHPEHPKNLPFCWYMCTFEWHKLRFHRRNFVLTARTRDYVYFWLYNIFFFSNHIWKFTAADHFVSVHCGWTHQHGVITILL